MLRWGPSKRSVAVIACASLLAGCQSLSDFGSEMRETFQSRDKSLTQESVPAHGTIEEKEETVTLDRPAVRRLQARLARLGFEPGPVDGIMGSQTAKAIKRYQTVFGLAVTGAISSKFSKHLEAMSAGEFADARPPVNLGFDDFPTYLPGTTFIYSNGNTERVVSAKNHVVRWVRGDGKTYIAHRNFLLPKSYWESGDERGTAMTSSTADELWPLREGAEVSFSAEITMQRRDNPDSTKQRIDQWRCRNDGHRDITVEAGTFKTLVLVCLRGTKPAFPEVIRTWYYSKTVRHNERFVQSYPERNTTVTVDLVAIRPSAPSWPPIARAALARAVVHTLEIAGNKSRMSWTSSGVNARVIIEAKSRFVADNGKPCRRFVQIWSENNRRRHYPAIACQTVLGRWNIPGLESSTTNSLATSGGLGADG